MAFSSGEYEMARRNSIWKPLCIKYFNVNPFERPIIDRECLVEPAFEIVANSSPNLSNICSWRIRYTQEIHVISNWIRQRYRADEPAVLFADYGFILGNFVLLTSFDAFSPQYNTQ